MTLARPIAPNLWFDTQAREAAGFYCDAFPESKITSVVTLHDTPSGDCDVVSFELWGQPFMAISAGPLFKANPSVSFFVNFDPLKDTEASASLDALWAKLADGGKVLMEVAEYPWSKRYGWVEDRFGISWQLILADKDGELRPPIMPSLMFTGDNAGKAAEAAAFYRTAFEGSMAGRLALYPEDREPDPAGTVMYSDVRLGPTWFAAMDSAHPHGFAFNEAISFVVQCRDQEELDRYWAALSTVPDAEQCGWCKDKYGLSWQVTPTVLGDLMTSGDQAVVDHVMQALLEMKKIDVAAIEAAAKA